MSPGLLITLCVVLGFIGGWMGASLEHIAIIHRINGIEGLLRAQFAANARRAQKERMTAALAVPTEWRPQNPLDVPRSS